MAVKPLVNQIPLENPAEPLLSTPPPPGIPGDLILLFGRLWLEK